MKVIYDPIGLTAPRLAASVNDLYTAFATASAAVQADNIAEDALTADLFTTAPATRVARILETTRTLVPISAVYIPFVQNAVTFRSGALGALLAGETLRIRTWSWAETTLAAGLGLAADPAPSNLWRYRQRHAWNDGAATAKITASERQIGKLGVYAVPNAYNLHGAFMIESWLHGPKANVAYVELQQIHALGIWNASRTIMIVQKFRRMQIVSL